MILCTLTLLPKSIVDLYSNFYWNLGNVYWMRANAVSADSRSSFIAASYFWSLALNTTSQKRETILLYLGSAYERVGRFDNAKSAWKKLTQPTIVLLDKGQTWLGLKIPTQAIPWFRGITLIDPDLSDGWYYLAQSYIQHGQADKALLNLRQALDSPRIGELGKSEIYFLLGYTYQYVAQPPQLAEALHAYQKALEIQDFSNSHQIAETHFRICDALWASGANPYNYAKACQQAIGLNPKHLLARFLLGIAIYNQSHDVVLAEKEFQTAFNIEPSPWGLVMLAHYVYEPAGLKEKAKMTYNIVLQRWPTFDLTQKYLDKLK